MSISRADKGGFANWWFTVDKVALIGMALLIGIGLMLAFAASPAITGGPLSAGDFRYAARQLTFAGGAAIMAGASLLTIRQVKITAAIVFAVALVASFLVLFVGIDVLGARREINFGPSACSLRNSSSPASPSWPPRCWRIARRWPFPSRLSPSC